MEPDDPPRKKYGFKDREFPRDNAPAAGNPLPTAKELAMMAGPVAPTASKAPPEPKAGDPNDVEIKVIKSRRKRDFWLVLVGGNLAIIGAVWFSGINVTTVVFGLAGLIVFSIGLSWIMWQVMDRY
jgi:uncharacterized integral membrane protein